MEIYIIVNFVIRELYGSIEKLDGVAYYTFNVLTVTTVKYTVQVIHNCCVSVT